MMEINEIKKAVLEKGDMLIIRYSGSLKQDHWNEMAIEKRGFKPEDITVFVLERGMDIEVIKTK